MRKIKNVHRNEDKEKYHCFGCAPHNKSGLQLEFWEDGDEVLANWEPKHEMMGWTNVVHGGIQATLMDEVSGWLVYVKCATAGVTAELNVKYRKPVMMDKGPVTVRAKLLERNKRLATIETRLECNGELCAEGLLKFFLYPETLAREKFYYPGVAAFFDE